MRGNLAERFSHRFLLSKYHSKNLVLISDDIFKGRNRYKNEGRYFYAVTKKVAEDLKRRNLVYKKGRRYVSFGRGLYYYIFLSHREKSLEKIKKAVIDFKEEAGKIYPDAVIFVSDGSIDFYEFKSGSSKLTQTNKKNFERLKCLEHLNIYVLRCDCDISKSANVKVEEL